MSQYAYEIASWPASEAYLKDPKAVGNPAFSSIVGQHGARIIYHASAEEDPRIGVVVEYETHEDYKTLNANLNGEHTRVREKFAPTKGQPAPGAPGLRKVITKLTADPVPALQAPLTEITFATPKPGTDVQSLAETLGKLVAASNSSATPAVGAVHGSVIGDPETLVLITGWKSSEEYKQVVEIDNKEHVREIQSQSTLVVDRYRFIEIRPQ
ncbi:hypothetical protein BC827DRAFT_1151561 [Russula dissimulans]|nr:hypothetical protein BC827DRAFT_1151561 [Russula dissimulans]